MTETDRMAQLNALVNVRDIANWLGISRQRVDQITKRPEFPKVAKVSSGTRYWLRPDVEAFIEKWDRTPGRRERMVPDDSPVSVDAAVKRGAARSGRK